MSFQLTHVIKDVMTKQSMRSTKPPTRSALVKQLDHLVSQIVRARDKCCVMCGSTDKLGCGHVFSRRHLSTRWDLLNTHAQCWKHNFLHVRDQYPYFNWFINRFGKEVFDTLYANHSRITHLKESQLLELKKELEKELAKWL